MSTDNGNIWKPVAYAFAAFSQTMVMLLLYLIFNHLGILDSKVSDIAVGQARMEGVVSSISVNNPAAPINKPKADRTSVGN
jgi:hypothetical protein